MENFELKGFAKGKKQQKEQVGGNAIIYTRVSSRVRKHALIQYCR